MKWIANCPTERKAEDIAVLTRGQPNRRIIEGDPEASERWSVGDLKRMGIIGLYEDA